MGTGAGEAVQQSSDAAKDDELPRLEGEEVGLLTTTVLEGEESDRREDQV